MIVFLGWSVDIDLPNFEGTTDNSELTTITTACLPTSVTSATTCTVAVLPSRTATTTTTAGQPTVSLINRVSVGTLVYCLQQGGGGEATSHTFS